MGINTQPVLSNFFKRLRANNGWAETVAKALPREEDKRRELDCSCTGILPNKGKK